MAERIHRPMEAILADVKTRCGNKLIAHGFHKAVGLTQNAYMDSLPSFIGPIKPGVRKYWKDAWEAGLRIPFFVDYTISPADYLKLLNIDDPLHVMDQLEVNEGKGRIAKWCRMPQEESEESTVGKLKQDGETDITDILALFAQHSKYFLDAIMFATSSVRGRSDLAPYIYWKDADHRPLLGLASKSKTIRELRAEIDKMEHTLN